MSTPRHSQAAQIAAKVICQLHLPGAARKVRNQIASIIDQSISLSAESERAAEDFIAAASDPVLRTHCSDGKECNQYGIHRCDNCPTAKTGNYEPDAADASDRFLAEAPAYPPEPHPDSRDHEGKLQVNNRSWPDTTGLFDEAKSSTEQTTHSSLTGEVV